MNLKDNKIGFVGLGVMGSPMALNVLKAGIKLSVYNRTIDKTSSLKDTGADIYHSPRELAQNTDIIIIMVTGDEALTQIMNGPDSISDGLSDGKTIINMSTVSYEATVSMSMLTKSKNCSFLDAPVSGTKKPAEDGTLVILTGGEKELSDKMEPLLLTMGKEVVYCGDIGQGTHMKLMINMLLGGMMSSFCEALTYGKKQGLDLHDMLSTIGAGAMDAPMFKVKGNVISEKQFTKTFSVDLLYKDLNLALDSGAKAELPLPITAAACEAYEKAVEMGLGDKDIAALIQFYEKIADTKID